MAQRRAGRSAKATASSDLAFEDAFAQMQTVIAQLEEGDMPLEDAITSFEQGMRLAQHCNTLLDRAQLRVQALEEAADGTLVVADIEIVTE